MDNLLPCPFCGGEAQLRHESTGWWTVGCKDKKCLTAWNTNRAYHTEAEAIAAWNTRAERTCRMVDYYDEDLNWTVKAGDCEEVYAPVAACSACGEVVFIRNYCSNCGAKVVE